MPSGDDVFMRDLIDWAAPVDPEGTWELSGVVDHVIYANEETGYHVLELLCGSQTVTVVGEIPQVYEGEKLCAVGKFVFHRSHGRQFSVENVRRELPDNRDDIMRYLMSGAVKGIGPVLAERIFDTFGDEALYILENDPMMVAEVKGVSRAKALKIAEELTKLFDLRRMMIFLAEYGLRPSESMRVVNTLGDRTMMMVEENPYILCCYAIGLDFGRVDALAQERGFSYDNRERVEAGVTHVLRHNLGNGHTCLPTDKLLAAASSLLRCEPDSTEDALQRLLDREDVIAEEFGERQYIFLSECHRAERCIAETIRMMHLRSGSRPVSDGEIDDLERTIGITYEQYQRQAIRTALTSGVTIITGGPGTGKTTILNAVMQLFTRRGKSVSLAAPTGRAAKRMSEVTGCEATTIHRLLESEHSNDEGYVNFKRNAQNPLTADVVIIDEASMCDIFLTEALLSAMKLSATLVLVGDADQLPAVGAGSVMRDLIASGTVSVILLTEIYRQAAESHIVVNAHRINNGEMPDLTRDFDADFFFLPTTTDSKCAQTVVDLCARRLPNSYGWSPFSDIQCLSPGKKGTLGTHELNKRLQEALNPPNGGPQIEFAGVSYRVGDKIMQVRNDYDILWKKDGQVGMGLYNGDCGLITDIQPRAGIITADFDGRVVSFNYEQLTDIEPAYAVTVHKSQGSEYEAVVIPVFEGYSRQLMFRNLLYTAVTRAKSLLVLVGSEEVLHAMVSNERKSMRFTGLRRFLTEPVEQSDE